MMLTHNENDIIADDCDHWLFSNDDARDETRITNTRRKESDHSQQQQHPQQSSGGFSLYSPQYEPAPQDQISCRNKCLRNNENDFFFFTNVDALSETSKMDRHGVEEEDGTNNDERSSSCVWSRRSSKSLYSDIDSLIFSTDELHLSDGTTTNNNNNGNDDETNTSTTTADTLNSDRETVSSSSVPSQSLFNELSDYVQYLREPVTTIPQLNAMLRDYMTRNDISILLLKYYASHPRLTKYTLKTELKRMSYAVRDGEELITDPALIRHRYAPQKTTPEKDLLFRAANQSLLADAIEALSSETALIRPQFHVTARATDCRFFIDLTNYRVRCDCVLQLTSLSRDERWDMGVARIRVMFSLRGGPCYETEIRELDVPLYEEAVLARVANCLRKKRGSMLNLTKGWWCEDRIGH